MRHFWTYGVLFFLCACSSKRSLRPLGLEESEIHAAVGGPVLIQSDLPVPAPYLTAGYVYGFSDFVNLEAGLHVTPLFYKVLAFDFGYLVGLSKAQGLIPSLSFGNRFNIGSDFKHHAFVPQFDLTAAFDLDSEKNNVFYLGPEYIYSWSYTGTENFFSMFAGYRLLLNEKYTLGLEFKWLLIDRKISDTAVNYWSPFGDRGRPGIYFNFSRKL